LASQTARNTCHLLALAPGAQRSAAICPATMASVSDRRPKGVVEICSIILVHLNKRQAKAFRNASSVDKSVRK